MQDLLIFPFNGNALEAYSCLGKGEYNLIGFIDDTIAKQGITEFGVPVLDRSALSHYPKAKVLAVPGGPKSYHLREEIISGLGISDERFATVIHPRAEVSSLSKLGKNVLIMANVVLTSNCVIQDHVIVLPNTVIHHDVLIKSYTSIGSNVTVAGYVSIGKNCYIGSAASIINNCQIADGSLVGIGANVIHSVNSKTVLIGNPARKLE